MTKSHHHISPEELTVEKIYSIITKNQPLALSVIAKKQIQTCRDYLDQKISSPEDLFYGINTGFGSLCDVRISPEHIEDLQQNLVMSHAVGVGNMVPKEVVKIMLLLKIQSLSYGYSAVRVELVERLIEHYNADVLPVIFELGSLGASGDLAPLAHLSLPLIGMGEVWQDGKRSPAAEVLAQKNWKPLRFQAKESLALLNGTQFSTAYGVWILLEAKRLMALADFNAAIGVDAFNCRLSPFDHRLHEIRPHAGQIQVAAAIRNILKDSVLAQSEKTYVQDPYSFRCVPQVHGASKDALAFVEKTVLTEMNAVTDNPNVFPDDDLILSGGNFHAQPIALAMDYCAIALAELGSISERRVYQLISGQRGLPVFLTPNPGLHSGLMIAQYTAAAIVNQNKTLCAPASTDSIVSCNGQEDHVSMAANAATKARQVVLNLERLLSIEFMVAMQALDCRKHFVERETGKRLASATLIEKMSKNYRKVVPLLENDRILSTDIEKTIGFLRDNFCK